MGGNLPVTTQRQLGFGAAASMVHPATGKQYLELNGLYIFLSYGVLLVLINVSKMSKSTICNICAVLSVGGI